MAEPKTTPTGADVADFLGGVADPARRADAEALCALMADVTGRQPRMWGTSIVGFGGYQYRYGTGRQGEWAAVGLSPRKQALTVYLPAGFTEYADLMSRLGPHSTGKSCLYLKRLADVDESVLRELLATAFRAYDGRTITT